MKKLSQFVLNIDESATLAASNRAKALAAQGRDIINLSVGQPDFATPESIQQAAISAIHSGKASWYTQASGLPELKGAVAHFWQKNYGYSITPKEILVTAGAKFALYAFFQSVIDPGDEVIIPAPYWVSYVDQVKMAAGKPVIITTHKETDYKITPADLDAVVTKKSKVLLLNNPSNPTGALYSKEELTAIGDWAFQHDLLILADEIYHKLIYNAATWTPLSTLGMRVRERTVIINGVSKTFSMTGWRIGVAVGDPEIIAAMAKIASQTTSNPSTAAQYAAIEAFDGGAATQKAVEAMRDEFEHRLNTIYPLITAIPGFELNKPAGAFYLFPRVLDAMELTGFNFVGEFADALLEEKGVALVAGSAFGAPENVRLSYAVALDSLTTAIQRIHGFVDEHSQK